MAMAASIVEYTVGPEHADELHRRVRERLLPAAQRTRGYRGMLLLDRGDGKRLAILLFDSMEQVGAAKEALTPVGREHTYALMQGPALGSAGTVVIGDGVFGAVAGPHGVEPPA
jgi:hypothetical protein